MAPIDQYLMADRAAEIALARSAAPESIPRDAEVMILGRHGFETAVKGKKETINRRNLDALNELVAENFIEQVPLPGQGPGQDGLRYAIGMFLSAFPDIQWIVDQQIAEGEKVVSRFTWTGTHRR
jgi:predicted ester cyclase